MFVRSLLAGCSLAVATVYAVSGAGFTTVNEAVDGPDPTARTGIPR